MAERSELLDHAIDAMLPLGHASGRAMFGGYGVYLDGLIIGIIAWDTLYLKVDAGNRLDYEAAGSQPFTYEGRGKPIVMPYWEVPPDILDDVELLRSWAAKAREAARRLQVVKLKRQARRRPSGKARQSHSSRGLS